MVNVLEVLMNAASVEINGTRVAFTSNTEQPYNVVVIGTWYCVDLDAGVAPSYAYMYITREREVYSQWFHFLWLTLEISIDLTSVTITTSTRNAANKNSKENTRYRSQKDIYIDSNPLVLIN